MSDDRDEDTMSEEPDEALDHDAATEPLPVSDEDTSVDEVRSSEAEESVAVPRDDVSGSQPAVVSSLPGRGIAIGALGVAALLAFAIGAALGKGFAPSASDAAVARIDARDAAREQAHEDAYKTAYDEAFATEKQRGAVAGTRQGTVEGKRAGKAAAAKQVPAAAPAPAAVDCPAFDMDGVDYASGAGYFDISVRGMQCQEAKNLILTAGTSANFTGLQAHGWNCQSLGSEGETSQYRCSDARDRVFRWWFGA